MVIALSCCAFEAQTLQLKDVRQMHDETFYRGYIKYLSEVNSVFQKVLLSVNSELWPMIQHI